VSKHEIIDVLNEDGAIVDTISREQAELDNHITENVLEDLEWISRDLEVRPLTDVDHVNSGSSSCAWVEKQLRKS